LTLPLHKKINKFTINSYIKITMKKYCANTHTRGFGTKMLPFAGYNMPILYEGVNAEHETVRNAVGVLMFHTWNSLFRVPMLWL
jgi:hypothetical protein